MEGLVDFLHNLLPASWFESVKEHFGQGLTDHVVAQSVHEASLFFGMDDPVNVHEDWTTGVMTNMSWTENDDVLIFNRQELADLGITDKAGFDLVMTHEGAHRMLQGMQDSTHYSTHQEELCCDYMAGVRAGLNGMDEGKMQSALADQQADDTHPEGKARVESIENGVVFAHEFMDKYHHAPTFADCLEHFEQTEVYADAGAHGQIGLSLEGDENTLHGLTEGDRQRHITKAKLDMADAESDIRHRTYMIKSKAAMGEPFSYEESMLREAKERLQKARKDLNRAYAERPDTKKFVGTVSAAEIKVQDALDRADATMASAEALAESNDVDLGWATSHVSVSADNSASFEFAEDRSNLKEMFVNSKTWNSDQAKWYQEKVKVEKHAADLAQQKGDYASMREHNRLAVSYQKMADQYAKDAKESTQ